MATSARSNPGSGPDAGVALRFPCGFRFGAATAAHQVEGGNERCDWWDFERLPGRIADKSRSGRACDHYHRFREDLDLLVALGLTTYRFSIEWARVEPEPGQFDRAALDHYAEVIDACRERGIEPCVTLYHFTLPRWFARQGGWVAASAPDVFGRYVRAVQRAVGEKVALWVTLNEPVVYLYQGYMMGIWPPAERDVGRMLLAGRNLLRAHFEAYAILRARAGFGGQPPSVGIAHHVRIFDPARPANPLDRLAAAAQAAAFNWSFLDSVHQGLMLPPFGLGEPTPRPGPAHDFVGVNYYSRGRVRVDPSAPGGLLGAQETTPGAPRSDLGWEIYPEGLLRALREVDARYGRPIWITENGIADASDRLRPRFLVDHLAQVAQATAECIPVKGYYHWSLLDNFEWAEGFTPRFGLYAMDYATGARSLRPSGALYARIAREREIAPDLLDPR
jgi:beta-glucosidase